jgi:hypothetical protein
MNRRGLTTWQTNTIPKIKAEEPITTDDKKPIFDIRSEWDGSEVDVSEFSIKVEITSYSPSSGSWPRAWLCAWGLLCLLGERTFPRKPIRLALNPNPTTHWPTCTHTHNDNRIKSVTRWTTVRATPLTPWIKFSPWTPWLHTDPRPKDNYHPTLLPLYYRTPLI